MSIQDSLSKLNEIDINNIDFSRMGVWPAAGKLFVCALITAIILGATYYMWISDLNNQLQTVQVKEQELRGVYQKKSFEAANLDAYKAQMQEMEKTFEGLLSRLPAKSEVPGLLEDIGTRGSESGLTINSVTIQKDRVAEYYIEVPIAIDADGGYHDMGNFVSGVAAMARIVTLDDFTITTGRQNNSLNLKINAKTYRFKSSEEEANK
jgi:type IV pilus assembly protein PilO